MAGTCAQTSVNDSPMNFVIATNADGIRRGRGEQEEKGVDDEEVVVEEGGTRLTFGGWFVATDRDLHHRRRYEPSRRGRGLFRGLNIHTPPPVGGVYRLRAIPTRHRGTDTRYQRTLVAPMSVEQRRSAASTPLSSPHLGRDFSRADFSLPIPSRLARCVCPVRTPFITYSP